MSTKQMLKYHLGLPVLLFVVLLVIGAPILTAFFVACMAGCASMMFMMGGHASGPDGETRDGHESDRALSSRNAEDTVGMRKPEKLIQP